MGKCHDFCNCHDCSGNGKHKESKKESCDFVKDKICCEWFIPRGHAQNVYIAAGVNVFASGFISVNCDGVSNVTVRFFKDNKPVGQSIGVFEGSCTTFTAANFNRIEVSCPGGSNGSPYGSHEEDNFCSGKICITPRYQVNCDSHGHGHEDCGCE